MHMTGPQTLAIVKDIYAENVDVEDKLTAMQDVFCMCNLQADNPCRRISKKEMIECLRWLLEEYI